MIAKVVASHDMITTSIPLGVLFSVQDLSAVPPTLERTSSVMNQLVSVTSQELLKVNNCAGYISPNTKHHTGT